MDIVFYASKRHLLYPFRNWKKNSTNSEYSENDNFFNKNYYDIIFCYKCKYKYSYKDYYNKENLWL